MAETCPEYATKPLLTDKSCNWCGDTLPVGSRADAKYCCGRCRYYAAVDRGKSGRVNSTRVLKDGRVSVVIYMDETALKAGQFVKVGVDD